MPTLVLHSIEPTLLSVPEGRNERNQCRLDSWGLSWNDQRVRYDAITALSYTCRQRTLNLVQRRLTHHVRLSTTTGDLHLALGLHAFGPNHDTTHADAYRAIVATLHAMVEPRLRAQILRSMAAGRTVAIGKLRLSSHHLQNTLTGEKVDWRQLPSGQIEHGCVTVGAAIERDTAPLAAIDMLTPNAPLLPELLDEAAVTFS